MLVKAAPRLRNVVLAKCVNITDRSLVYLSQLEHSLHYLHLGHCSNITDRGVAVLVKRSPRIQYIDVACCTQLTNQAVIDLATLPRLKRIGLVKCQNITDLAIQALAKRKDNTLERIHLSYCTQITLLAIRTLVNECNRLTHLSLTGVQPFLNPEFTQFCRAPPSEFTQHQQAVFCVFSGSGVLLLRNKLNELEHDRQNNLNAFYYPGAGAGGLPPGLPVPPTHPDIPAPGLDTDDIIMPDAP
jgi:F-box and leucine-rich repeat protein GRR1